MANDKSGTTPDDAPSRGAWSIARTVLWTTAICAAVAASLLTFPSSIMWMIAFWLVWHTVSTAIGRPGWLSLATCVLILVIKRVYWPPTLYVFVAATVVVAVMVGVITAAGELDRRRHLRWGGVGLLWLISGLAGYQWRHAASVNHPVQLHPTKPIVCIGDSLTSGVRPYGGNPGYGYLRPKHDWDNQEIGMAAVAVYAPERTRESVFRALYDRRTYATSGDRIVLNFSVDGHPMGTEFRTESPPELIVEAVGTAPIALVELKKNSKVVGTFTPKQTSVKLEWRDDDFKSGRSSHYYARILQEDNEEAISSPVWVN